MGRTNMKATLFDYLRKRNDRECGRGGRKPSSVGFFLGAACCAQNRLMGDDGHVGRRAASARRMPGVQNAKKNARKPPQILLGDAGGG